jgi:hypothetical protein
MPPQEPRAWSEEGEGGNGMSEATEKGGDMSGGGRRWWCGRSWVESHNNPTQEHKLLHTMWHVEE